MNDLYGDRLGTLLLVILIIFVGFVSYHIGKIRIINEVNYQIEQEMVVSTDKISLENLRLEINRIGK